MFVTFVKKKTKKTFIVFDMAADICILLLIITNHLSVFVNVCTTGLHTNKDDWFEGEERQNGCFFPVCTTACLGNTVSEYGHANKTSELN